MTARVLLIDDEELFCRDLALLLEEEGFRCATAHTGEDGVRLAEEFAPDVVLCDLMLPDMAGVKVVDAVATRLPGITIVVITAFGTMETAVDAFRRGASDYLLKPLVFDDLLRKVRRGLEEGRLRREVSYLRRALSDLRPSTNLIGDSPAMKELSTMISKLAPADSTVLVTGESGTGKELVARALHESSPRAGKPFLAVNCAALPGELIESELFGHIKGAFTGATQEHQGYFQLSQRGTLFLDEIGDLPLELQPKLLRALETRTVTPVGSGRPTEVDVRIVAATNRDLAEDVEAGRFRNDLYYRIRVVELNLPPLRERRGDIPKLAEHLLGRVCRRLGRRILGIDPAALAILLQAPWPGNVRELENTLERAVLLTESDSILPADLPPELSGETPMPVYSEDLRLATRQFEELHIRRVLREADDNREDAARRLGIDASTLYRRLQSYDSES